MVQRRVVCEVPSLTLAAARAKGPWIPVVNSGSQLVPKVRTETFPDVKGYARSGVLAKCVEKFSFSTATRDRGQRIRRDRGVNEFLCTGMLPN